MAATTPNHSNTARPMISPVSRFIRTRIVKGSVAAPRLSSVIQKRTVVVFNDKTMTVHAGDPFFDEMKAYKRDVWVYRQH